MVVSPRERYIVAATAAVLALLAVDRFAVEPLLNQRAAIDAQKAALAGELSRAQDLVSLSSQNMPMWNAMRAGLQAGPAEAESQILHAIGDWAEDSRLTLSLLKPERLTGKTRLPQIAFQAAGTGSMEAVTRFFWRLETATIPIKVTELQLASRKEGTDDMSVQLRISTVYLPERPQPIAAAAKPSKATEAPK